MCSLGCIWPKKNGFLSVSGHLDLGFSTGPFGPGTGPKSIFRCWYLKGYNDDKVVCFHIFLLFFCCVPILYWKSWSFLLVVEHQKCHVPPISPFYQRNLYFGMLGHSVELFLGQIFLCLKGEWCWHPSAQFKRFWFFILPPNRNRIIYW